MTKFGIKSAYKATTWLDAKRVEHDQSPSHRYFDIAEAVGRDVPRHEQEISSTRSHPAVRVEK